MQEIDDGATAQKPGAAGIGRKDASSSQVVLRAAITFVCLSLLAAVFLLERDGEPRSPVSEELVIVMRAAPNLVNPDRVPEIASRLAVNGVTHVLLQFKQDETDEFTGGEVFFPSAIAPVANGFADDRIARLIESLGERDIRVSAWLPTLHDPAAAGRHADWRAWWLPEDGDREDQESWLCPSSEAAVAYQASIAAEIMHCYPQLAGLFIDFIRYDSDFSCVCDRCLGELDNRVGWNSQHGRALSAEDVRQAGAVQSSLWQDWIDMRAEHICDAVNVIRDRVDEVREDCPIGACVLPFSASDYSFNTQSGQDLYEMARAGLDEIVLMGYWDDWNKKPEWLTHCMEEARRLVEGECALSCLIDADMAPRRTLLTLDAVTDAGHALDGGFLGFFQYQAWDHATLAHVQSAVTAHSKWGETPRPPHTNIVIRVDTEPDDSRSYAAVHPGMIRALMDMFEAEGVRGTFITCGRLAELQPEVVREAASRGHEIGNHAYDHEQLDALSKQEQVAVIDRSVAVFRAMGLECIGFGAPRNSVTAEVRQRLIHHGFRYDGSEAYDPMEALMDPHYVGDLNDADRLLVIPFIWPNDWDALRLLNVSSDQMLNMWKERLDAVIDMGEPCFVLDVHQWLASQPDNLAALRSFIRHALSQPSTRMTTFAQAAADVDAYLAQFELASESREMEHKP